MTCKDDTAGIKSYKYYTVCLDRPFINTYFNRSYKNRQRACTFKINDNIILEKEYQNQVKII